MRTHPTRRTETIRLAWTLGQVIDCGVPSSVGGKDEHQPIDGKHLATVVKADVNTFTLQCACGHEWSTPRTREWYL